MCLIYISIGLNELWIGIQWDDGNNEAQQTKLNSKTENEFLSVEWDGGADNEYEGNAYILATDEQVMDIVFNYNNTENMK